MGFSSLVFSANHQVLATFLSYILTIFTWFSSVIWAAFIRFVASISHCSASNGFLVQENTAGCSFLIENIS